MTPFEDIPKEVMYKALKRIHRNGGITCEYFPECGEKACDSAYDSFAVADMVLHYQEGKNYPFNEEII